MRGARKGSNNPNDDVGIIPADAGSTLSYLGLGGGHRDHPRGCGEHIDPPEKGLSVAGSSPRMRGAR